MVDRIHKLRSLIKTRHISETASNIFCVHDTTPVLYSSELRLRRYLDSLVLQREIGLNVHVMRHVQSIL